MAKSSTARQEREQRVREREASLPNVAGTSREAMSGSLDRLIHERVRLGIVSALAVNRNTPKARPAAKIHFNRQWCSSHARPNMAMISVTCARLIHELMCVKPRSCKWAGAYG